MIAEYLFALTQSDLHLTHFQNSLPMAWPLLFFFCSHFRRHQITSGSRLNIDCYFWFTKWNQPRFHICFFLILEEGEWESDGALWEGWSWSWTENDVFTKTRSSRVTWKGCTYLWSGSYAKRKKRPHGLKYKHRRSSDVQVFTHS